MKFIKTDSYSALSIKAADIICDVVKENKSCVLGLATGSSPLGAYAEIIKKYNSGEVDFSSVRSVNLDEYVGLDGSSDQSYKYFMNENFFKHINIKAENTRIPNGRADDTAKECSDYDEYITSLGGIDLQLLGIGLDGHIGFNEPDEFFTKQTHVVKLDKSTIKANARFFKSEDDVPKSAITMGMGAIMSARKVLLIANGDAKREIVEKAFFGPITPLIPASILQLHNDLTVIFSEN